MPIKVDLAGTNITALATDLAEDVVGFVYVNALEVEVFANTQLASGSGVINQAQTMVASGTKFDIEEHSGSASISQASTTVGAGSKLSDPLTLSFEVNDWGQAYYGTDGQSGQIPDNGGNQVEGSRAMRFGWNWNNEDDVAMLAFSAADAAALDAMITERPNISKITFILSFSIRPSPMSTYYSANCYD